MKTAEKYYRQFLIGYVSAGHTVDDDVEHDLNELTDQFIEYLDPQYYFSERATECYLDYLDENLSDENKHWFPLVYNERRYINHLQGFIQYLIRGN